MSNFQKDKVKAFREKCRIKRAMRSVVADCFDRRTDEVNYTRLAEMAADACDCHTRLDDETDPIWDWALEVGDAYERQHAFRV